MDSTGEELHPNWRALATIHLPLKRFIKASTEKAPTIPDRKYEIEGGSEIKQFYEEILTEETTEHSVRKQSKPATGPIGAIQNKQEADEAFDKNKFFRCASDNNAIGIRRFILEHNDVNACDDYGWTALMMAACEGATAAVHALLELGASKEKKDKRGNTALDLARKKGHLATVELLERQVTRCKTITQSPIVASLTPFFCEICQRSFTETTQAAHQTSTVHQFNAKSMLPPNKLQRFNIPQKNRGLQLMVKQGWDKESGLGPTQNGRLYPVKTVIRKQRTGLGVDQPAARVTHFEAFDTRATKRRNSDYYKKKPRNRNDIRREKVHDWKRERRLRQELS